MRITPQDILAGPIGPTLWRMTTPMVVGILVMITFQAVDTFYVSLLGTVELAAISFTFPVTFTISNVAIGLSIATSVLLAGVIGRGEKTRAQRFTTDSLLLIVLVVIVISIAGLLTIDPVFRWLGATESTLPLIRDYIGIWYCGVVFIVIPMVANSAIRATGDTKSPSQLMMLAGFMNAILDPILIFGFGPVPAFGVKGAAIATVLSWMLACAIALYILHHRERLIAFSLAPAAEMLAYWRQVARIGLPISLANMLTPIAVAVATALIAAYGEHAVAGFGAGSRIDALCIVVPLALTASLSPYIAQNIGAGNIERAHEALRLATRFVFLFQLALWPLVALTSPWLARIFSADPDVLPVTQMYLWIMPLANVFFGILLITNTGFNSARQSHKTLLCSGLRLLLCYAPLAWLGRALLDIPGIYLGIVLANVLAAGFAWQLSRRMFGALRRDARGSDGEEDVDAALETAAAD